jgi:hypothetical protein
MQCAATALVLLASDVAIAKERFILASGRRDPRIYAIDFDAALKAQNNNRSSFASSEDNYSAGYRGEVSLTLAGSPSFGRSARWWCAGGSLPGAGLRSKKRGPFQTVPVMARAIADRLQCYQARPARRCSPAC